MKKFKKLITYICLLTILITSVDVTSAFAGVSNPDDYEEYYNQLFATKASPYLISCQPSSAILLTDTVSLTPDDLSPNYYGGTVDLPRLSVDYYYSLGGNSNYYFGETVYPTLCWKTEAIGTNVTLNIKTHDEKRTVASFTVQIDESYSVSDTVKDKGPMGGVDFYYPANIIYGEILDADGSPTVLVPKRKFTDCSSELLNGLIAAGDNARYYDWAGVSMYDATMHKSCIVMPNYMYTPDEDFPLLATHTYNNNNIEDQCYDFMRKDVGLRNLTTVYNIKDYVKGLSVSDLREALLFAGSKFEDCIFDGNTGNSSTNTSPTDTDNLYYFIALGDECYFAKISTNTVDTDTFTQSDPSAKKMVWEGNKYYNVQPCTPSYDWDYDSPGFPDLNEETKDEYWDLMSYGPVSFDAFWKVAPNYGITLGSLPYRFLHNNDETYENMNLFAETLIYAGCIPHLANVTLKASDKYVTLNFYYHNPEDPTDSWTLQETKKINAKTLAMSDLAVPPTFKNYSAGNWCIDTDLKTPFDISTVDKETNSSYNLYCDYSYTGGYYNVTFYNDRDDTKEEKVFRVVDKPELPKDPESTSGYKFKNWAVVNSMDATSGVPYSASTFKPEPDVNYVFKTMWDVSGVIVKVLTKKTSYYVGEEIDTSLLQVYVQDTNDPDRLRVLEEREYTIDNKVVDKAGTFRFNITYTATGAQATCEVTGLPVYMTGIEASYNGGTQVYIGTSLKTKDFIVQAVYNNGKTETLTNFTMDKNTIEEGENVITISYAEFSATVTITGIKDPSKVAKLSRITASYTGDPPTVGDKIKPSSLSVTAFFSDNTSRTLMDTEFKYSPNKFKTAGEQTITITYSGLSTSVKVTVKPADGGKKPNENNPDDKKPEDNKPDNNNNNNNDNNDNNNNNNNNNNNQNTNSGTGETPNDSGAGHNTNDGQNNTDSNNNNNSNNNGGNNNNNNGNSNNQNNNGGGSNKNNEVDPRTQLASLGYLRGATILTDTLGLANTIVNSIDIDEIIEKATEETDVNLTLVNGASGNDLTASMLTKLKAKKLNMHVNMVSPYDNTLSVGQWELSGPLLDNTSISINPNITYEVTNKDTDKLLYFSVGNIAYPTGVTLKVIPEASNYSSGEVVRLYTCDINKDNATMINTLTWNDTQNSIDVNTETSVSYCFSNALDAYETGGSLMSDVSLPSIVDPEKSEYEETEGTENMEDSTEMINGTEEPFNWDDPVEEPDSPDAGGKKFPFLLIIIIAVLLLLLGTLAIVMLLRKSHVRSADRMYDEEFDEPENEGEENYEEPLEEDEDYYEEDESEQ